MRNKRFLWLIPAAIVLVALGAPFVVRRSPFVKNVTTRVAGKVVDSTTGQPVHGARVLIRFDYYFFLSHSVIYYGLVSDKTGDFAVNATTPFEPTRVLIEAISPQRRYARQMHEGKDVMLKLGGIPNSLGNRNNVKFERFSGEHRWNFSSYRIVFIGEGWELRTPRQIEEGYPDPRQQEPLPR